MFKMISLRIKAHNLGSKTICIMDEKTAYRNLPCSSLPNINYNQTFDYFETSFMNTDVIVSDLIQCRLCVILSYSFDGVNPVTQVIFGKIHVYD